ncbi:replication-associated recombination protein A [bacterium]|nr:replication-associated recombination protein A [bacterium]
MKPDIKFPLAERMRPKNISEFVGQSHILGDGLFLRQAILNDHVPSLILWGPPGSGKTSLAHIIASHSIARFVSLSAVLSGIKEAREIMKQAQTYKSQGIKTILFIDEIHRFNKAQQDAFLPFVESGTIILIGATTENPSFEVIPPLLSRARVFVLKPLTSQEIISILKMALMNEDRGLGFLKNIKIEKDALEWLAEYSMGDARIALTVLENSVESIQEKLSDAAKTGKEIQITISTLQEVMQKKALVYDKGGEEHYNVISAFIKSMRGSDPDAALYWLARMLEAGEDPLFIARRMIIFASEDIGNADPQAIQVAVAAKDAFHFVGDAEGWIPLAQAVTYLASAPKSNASYLAYIKAKQSATEKGPLPVPIHLRNAPTHLMKDLKYGQDYLYPHKYSGGYVKQQYLPDQIKDAKFYYPNERGYEAKIAAYLKRIKHLNNK